MSGLEVLGSFDASYGLVCSAYNLLVRLRESWKNSKDVAEKLDELTELAKKIEGLVQRITAKLESCPRNAVGCVASSIIDVLQSQVDRNVQDAMSALKRLDKYQESSAGPSSGVRRFRRQLRTSRIGMTAKMMFSKSIPESLAEAELCLDKALREASDIEGHRLNAEILRRLDESRPPRTDEEKFVPHFDYPELPDHVVLDFCSMETQEGRLLRKLLALREKESSHGLAAVGRGSATHGMGGVGKTTALRAICRQERVKEAFPDGVCFLEFGQDAKDIDIQDQLEGCIYNFGGVSIVTRMEKQSSLEAAVNLAARWLREKAILFVCDDLWRSPASDYGFLPLLKRLVRYAPRSVLLISTRDKRIAEEVSASYETFGTLPSHGPSARSLLGQIAFGDEHAEVMKRPEVLGCVHTILEVCAGLQLALCMAGRALKIAIEEFGDVQKGFDFYARQVERDQRPDDTERGAQLYDHGLAYIVEASLVQCGQWAEKALGKVHVHDLFRSLCVLEKQMAMPRRMLSNLWGLKSRETDRVVRKFADLGLFTRTIGKSPSDTNQIETTEDYGVRLHDLVLKLCQEMAVDEEKDRHGRVVDALRRSKFVWIREEIPTRGEWWRLKNDGYVYGNLSRHLVKCGQRQALANLLSDVRWTRRRVDVGGWLALKMDFELLLEDGGDAEVSDIRQVYEVLERHWSDVSKNERLLPYFVGGSLCEEERVHKYTAQFVDSMVHYLARPFLVPRSKFLGPEDNREVSLLTCPRNPIYVVMDFSRSADLAVVGAFNDIRVWSISEQKELCTFRSQPITPTPVKAMLTCVAIDVHGRLIVAGYKDGTYQLWDPESGDPIGVGVKAHEGRVSCIAISKDGSTIVTGSRDKTLRLWNTKNGKPRGTPMLHEDVVTCVAICETRSMVVSGSRDKTVCRWNIETCVMIGEPMHGHEKWVRCVAVDDDGKMIVSGSDDKTLLRWDLNTGKQIGAPMCGHSDSVRCVAISPCGHLIVSGSWDRTLRVWEIVNGKLMGLPFRGHFSWVASVGFTEENGIVVSGSDDGTIRRWRMASGPRTSELIEKCEGRVRDIVFSDDGQKVITSCTNGTLLQWDANSGMRIGKPMKGRLDKVASIAMNHKCGMILAVYTTDSRKTVTESEAIRWNMSTCEMIGEPMSREQGSRFTCAALSSNGKIIATGSVDGTVQQFCAISGDSIGAPMLGHKKRVSYVAFCGNDEMIVTSSFDNSIIRWKSANGEQVGKPIRHRCMIDSFSISGDGTFIASHTYRDGLCRWDLVSGQRIGESIGAVSRADLIWTNNDCTKIVTLENTKALTWWCVDQEVGVLERSTLLSADVAACAIDMNRGIAAVGLFNGAVGICDIQE